MPDNNVFTNNEFRDNFSNTQNTTSNDDLLKELKSQSKILDEINSSLEKMASSGQGYRYQYEDNIRHTYDSNGRNNTTRERQGAQNTRSSSSSFHKSVDKDADDIKKTIERLKNILGDAVDEFENTVKDDLFGASMGDIMNVHLKKLAESLNAEVSDLPKMFASQLGKSVSNYIQNSVQNSDNFLAKNIGSAISDFNKMKVNMAESMSSMIGNMASKLFGTDINMGTLKDVEEELQKEKDNNRKNNTKSTHSTIFDSFFGTQKNAGYNKETKFYVEHAVIEVAHQEEKTNSPFKGDYSNKQLPSIVNKGEITEYKPMDMSEGFFKSIMNLLKSGGEGGGGIFSQIFGEGASEVTALSTGVESASAGMGAMAAEGAGAAASIGAMAASAVPVIGGLVALSLVIDGAITDFKEVGEAIKGWWEVQKKTRTRYSEETQQEISNSTKRLMDDVETIVREPFDILEDAANKVYEVWDNELRIINGTQGYTKSDMQDLMSNYAARLTEEGLSSVVSAADITEELAKVLNAGLSGAAAEEFAYVATVLNAAIPTQDFFDYADTYVSIAGNMIAQGYSEADALAYANEQLELFASNTLYASRELAGGFTTGLQHASDIFTQSVQIAQTAGSNNAAEISSVLTAVAAITGSIAPDLATTMTDLIYQAAVGGNSSELVALRSLAGINASNTEFLNALINDPQSVFVTMFTNLDKLINTSNDNYMEVAESLSEIFGISTDALRRIDFNYLADAISNMNVSDASLAENIALLASGETTTSAEQLRMQQINQYLLEEGLAYVVDNEAARFIQQHMWEEQIANDLMQATYGIELMGESKAAVQSILSKLGNLVSLNGSIGGWFKQRRNKVQAKNEEAAEIEDLETILEAGKVGEGNAQDLYNLTTRGVKLDLTDDLVTLLTGQQSAYSQTTTQGNVGKWRQFFNTGSKYQTADVVSSPTDASNAGYHSISSMYTWSTNVGKSTAAQAGMLPGGTPTGSKVSTVTTSSTTETESRLAAKVEQMLDEDYIRSIIEEGGGYEDWASTSRKFGITDLDSTLEDLGYSLVEVQDYFEEIQTEIAAESNNAYYARMEEYTLTIIDWLDQIYTFMDEQIYQDALMDNIYQDALTNKIYQEALTDNIYKDALTDKIYQDALTDNIYQHALMDAIYGNAFNTHHMYTQLVTFYHDWYEYTVQHKQYSAAYDHSNVSSIQQKEKSGSQDAIYALAEELTKNTVDLLDPTMQTNALLAEILIVVNAIMQNENAETSATSLTDTLSGLALGLFNTSTT